MREENTLGRSKSGVSEFLLSWMLFVLARGKRRHLCQEALGRGSSQA